MGRYPCGNRRFPANRCLARDGTPSAPASQELLEPGRSGRHEADGCRCRSRHQELAVAHSRPLPTPLAAAVATQVDEGPTWASMDGRPGTGPSVPVLTDDQDRARAAGPHLPRPPIPPRSAFGRPLPSPARRLRRNNRPARGSHRRDRTDRRVRSHRRDRTDRRGRSRRRDRTDRWGRSRRRGGSHRRGRSRRPHARPRHAGPGAPRWQ